MAAVFELRDVHYAYRDATALAGLDLTVSAGQCIALLGANGSGKSTLLRLLDGLYFADRGSVAAFGEVLSEARMQDDATAFAFRRRVGLVFQNAEVQLFNPTVFDEIAFTLLQFGLPRDEIRARVAASLAAFGIQHLKDRSPNRLSGGEQKRVALASVLVAEPEVLLLDEPTAELDPKSAAEVVAFLGGCRGSGRTVITATHDLGIVAALADLCVVLDAGRVAAIGPPGAVLGDAALLARTGLARGSALVARGGGDVLDLRGEPARGTGYGTGHDLA